jgi:hypothetical protein
MTYTILRFDMNKPTRVIATNLTLEEAKEHCANSKTKGKGWFDGYTEE